MKNICNVDNVMIVTVIKWLILVQYHILYLENMITLNAACLHRYALL